MAQCGLKQYPFHCRGYVTVLSHAVIESIACFPTQAMKKFPIHPKNPERICRVCDIYCAVNSMACSNECSPHPSELFGEDWQEWSNNLSASTPTSEPQTAPLKEVQ